jgi:hypothetical protein
MRYVLSKCVVATSLLTSVLYGREHTRFTFLALALFLVHGLHDTVLLPYRVVMEYVCSV